MRLAFLVFFIVVALLMIASGVIGLIARSRVPDAPRTRLLVTSGFRVAAGLVVLVVLIREY
jgi:hypothetical protein